NDTWKEEFDSRTVGEEKFDGMKCWQLELVAKPESGQAYQKLLIWTDQETYYPVKIEYYDKAGDHLKTLIMSDIHLIEDIPTAMKIVMTNHQKFTETRMEILEITYQWTPPKGFFSERSLKK
ncbi:MAG: outer membrane lipoprotein-sorting protein, partial [Candidatus Marinimicrobia bacterium]|nr:outer membrane lipoprotein-sorting protein [Candidatus Neomarinimicrobiota bacterium]